MKNLRVVFMGTPDFAKNILESLITYVDVVLVVTQPDQLNKKKEITYSSVKTCSLIHQLQIFQPLKITSDYQTIINLKPDLIVTAAYGQFIPKEVIDLCPAINIHGSLLPLYRGGAPIQKAIMNGDSHTGITIIHMTKKMDAGHMIAKASLEILETDTYSSVSEKLSLLGAKTLKDLIDSHGSYIPLGEPQDHSLVSFAYTLKREDEFLSFQMNAKTFLNRMRALLDQPVGHIIVDDIAVKVYHAKISDIIYSGLPGEIVETKQKLIIMCQDLPVELLVIQMPGKKKMDAKSFLNGQTIFRKEKVLI
jgi:methionyl-tRNA formyltransferase